VDVFIAFLRINDRHSFAVGGIRLAVSDPSDSATGASQHKLANQFVGDLADLGPPRPAWATCSGQGERLRRGDATAPTSDPGAKMHSRRASALIGVNTADRLFLEATFGDRLTLFQSRRCASASSCRIQILASGTALTKQPRATRGRRRVGPGFRFAQSGYEPKNDDQRRIVCRHRPFAVMVRREAAQPPSLEP
jgi:hypothetical protein